MYKMPAGSVDPGSEALAVIENHKAQVIVTEPEFSVVQLTGRRPETTALYEASSYHRGGLLFDERL